MFKAAFFTITKIWEQPKYPSTDEWIKKIYIYIYICIYIIYIWAGRSTSWNQDCWEDINNLRYADDTTLVAESEEELKSLLMKVKGE